MNFTPQVKAADLAARLSGTPESPVRLRGLARPQRNSPAQQGSLRNFVVITASYLLSNGVALSLLSQETAFENTGLLSLWS